MTIGRFSAPALATLVAIATACATSPAADTGAAPAEGAAAPSAQTTDAVMAIGVNHNRADGGIVTVYIEPAAGVRTALGTLEPGENKTFQYRVEAQNRNIRLISLNSSSQQMSSERITVPRGAGVYWDLQANTIRIRR